MRERTGSTPASGHGRRRLQALDHGVPRAADVRERRAQPGGWQRGQRARRAALGLHLLVTESAKALAVTTQYSS